MMRTLLKITALCLVVSLLLPATAACASAESLPMQSFAFTDYRDQLDDNGRALYDGMGTFDPDTLTVTVDLPNPVFTVSDGDAEDYLESQMEGLLLQAFHASAMDDPMSFRTWGVSMANSDAGSPGVSVSYSTVTVTGQGATLKGVTSVTLASVVDPAYADDPSTEENELREKIEALLAAVEEFSTGETSVRGIVGAVNKYIYDTVSYDPYYGDPEKASPYNHDAYGALVSPDHYAVCSGFSAAFQLLCEKYGVDVVSVVGKSSLTGDIDYHQWNYVRMDDGRWYGVDTTWEDSTGEGSFLLVGYRTEVVIQVKDNVTTYSYFYSTHSPGVVVADADPPYMDTPFGFTYPTISEQRYDTYPVPAWYEEYLPWVLAALMLVILGYAVVSMYRNGHA
jgi:hypothetical protein